MIPLTAAEVAETVGGSLDAVADAAGRSGARTEVRESRQVVPGALFVALPGERADGHDFAASASAAGAALVLAARPVGVPAVLVPDVVAALGRLAAAVLRRLPEVVVVGVTGSSGKTSTKDLLGGLLARLGPTIAPYGSYNNDIGHPLTVLRADTGTRHLVLELGARGPGHIAALCRIAPPRIGVELNVGSAHLGEFGSRAAIAAAKGELVEALPPAGLAVLSADDPLVAAMAARTSARVVTYGWAVGGEAPGPDVQARDVRLDDAGRASFALSAAGGSAPVSLQLVGEHHVANALAAAAVALELGLPLADTAASLGEARPVSRWRMEVTARPDGVTVVNDAYNANPESMRAALKTLVGLARGGRRSWAVLGEMGELGAESGREHEDLGRLAVRLGVDRLVVVGPGAGRVHAGAVLEGSWGRESVHVPDREAAVRLLEAELEPGDVVLVKASRAQGLELVAAAITGEGLEAGVPA